MPESFARRRFVRDDGLAYCFAMRADNATRGRTIFPGIAIAAGWTLLFFGWSIYLLWAGSRADTRALVRRRTMALAAALATLPPPRRDRFGGYSSWASRRLPLIASRAPLSRGIIYILIWKANGTAVFCAQARGRGIWRLRRHIIDSSLPARHWPALPARTDFRLRAARSLPWKAPAVSAWIATTRLKPSPGFNGFLTVGFIRPGVVATIGAKAFALLVQTAAVCVAGIVLIALIIAGTQRRFNKGRRQLEQGLRARTSLLTERGMLASILAHEVRSPLTALQFNLHTLRSLVGREAATADGDSRRKLELADLCEREIRRLDLMLNDFLQRTQVIGPPGNTSVNLVVHEALDFLRPQMDRRDIRVITHLAEADPHIRINADELRQVLLNLCANALDALPRGGTLVVSTVAEEDTMTLLVRDSGVGISPAVQQRLFEPFFTTKPQGSGLGLALVRRVVSGAGGKVFVESEPGEGATFRIVLPRGGPEPAPPTATGETNTDAWGEGEIGESRASDGAGMADA